MTGLDRSEHRLLVCSQLVLLIVTLGEVSLLVPMSDLGAWLWISAVVATVLGYLLIRARMRRLRSAPRGPAFRRALLWAPMLATTLCVPIGSALGTSEQQSVDDLLSTAVMAAVFGLVAGSVGYAAIERWLPESLREPDERRYVWRPSPAQRRKLLLAWLPASLVGFWLLTGLGTNTDCIVDGGCSSGIPVTFARYGFRHGSSMYWGRFALDLGLFLSLVPAAFVAATSRVRGVFVVYLLLVGWWIVTALHDSWGGSAGLSMWSQLHLLEL